MRYEYKVIPAPSRGRKAPGVKTPEDRFARGLEEVMNELAEDRWEYVRSDLLPSEERKGIRSSRTVYRSVLVFRRPAETGDMYMGDPREGQSYAQRLTAQRDLPEAPSHTASVPPLGPALRRSMREDSSPATPEPALEQDTDQGGHMAQELAETELPPAANDPDREPRNG